MRDKKDNYDYFGDDFEVTYTGDLPEIRLDDDTEEFGDAWENEEAYREPPRRRAKNQSREESGRRQENRSREDSGRRQEKRSRPEEELVSQIRRPVRTGTKAVEKLTHFVLRPAPIVFAAVITLITAFSFWDGFTSYGGLYALPAEQQATVYAYLAVAGLLLLWELSSFFFALSGFWSGTGRGLTFFILVYVCSWIASVAGNLVPENIVMVEGIRAGLAEFGSLYPMFFPFCVGGLVTCIAKQFLRK